MGAMHPTDAVDKTDTSPYLSFNESPIPLMMIKMKKWIMIMMKMAPRMKLAIVDSTHP